jgi:hypothetical protein
MSTHTAATLRAAADLIRREGWTQARFFDERTGCRCIAGALRECTDSTQWMYAVEALARQVGVPPWPTSIYNWNDDPDRTVDEVIAALEAAAQAAEAEV